ncbi:hypothetical protein EDC01DRAFT_622206 [Geopyxis carbonaria]|nr:hypothetical protein EDC01DRAFT_622206 [Geopyxis carbonaria]
MFSRIKGVIDSQIAAEQARTRNAQTRSSPSNSSSNVSRSSSRAQARSASRSTAPPEAQKEKDPSEFENDSDIATTIPGTPKRSSTPIPPEKVTDDPLGALGSDDSNGTIGGNKENTEMPIQNATTKESHRSSTVSSVGLNTDFPPEVRVKLRKLEKLEGRYADLLRSYKIVHARNSLIEPFEKALRENTPCESISDPKSLIDYINSFSVRSGLAKEEIIRVSQERDEYKALARKAQTELEARNKELSEMRDSISPIQSKSSSPKTSERDSTSHGKSDDIFNFDDEQEGLGVKVDTLEKDLEHIKRQLKTVNEEKTVAEEAVQIMQRSVEDSQMELEGLKDTSAAKDAEIQELRALANISKTEKTLLESKVDETQKELTQTRTEMQAKLDVIESNLAQSVSRVQELEKRKQQLQNEIGRLQDSSAAIDELRKNVADKDEALSKLRKEFQQQAGKTATVDTYIEEISKLRCTNYELQRTVANLERKIQDQKMADETSSSQASKPDEAQTVKTTPTGGGVGGKKKNKRKKKGKPAALTTIDDIPVKETETVEDETVDIKSESSVHTSESIISSLQIELEQLKNGTLEKDARISKLSSKIIDIDGLHEEIESLRDDLVNLGQDYVEACDKLKTQAKELWDITSTKEELESKVQELEAEISCLREQSTLSNDRENSYKSLVLELDELKQDSHKLQAELSSTKHLATSRFKDLTDLRSIVEKMQPELMTLRAENSKLAAIKSELENKVANIKQLERIEQDLKNDMRIIDKKLTEKDNEIVFLKTQISEESSKRLKLEEQSNTLQKDIRRAEDQCSKLVDDLDQAKSALTNAQSDVLRMKSLKNSLEGNIKILQNERDELKEELELKSAQVASTQSLMNSMQDQTSELVMQAKEAQDQRESIEEEIVEIRRLLSERTRETETMRRLLNEMETRNETKGREMKEQMEVCIKERDKAEEDVTIIGRRRTKEVEDMKDRLRDAEKKLKRAEEAGEQVESELLLLREAKQRVDEILERESRELEDSKRAIASMTSALDETDNQVRDIERQKTNIQQRLEYAEAKCEKLQKQYWTLQDENRLLQNNRIKTADVENSITHSRSSVDSTRSKFRVVSPKPTASEHSNIDLVYLKNVLLQFMELKDKNKQRQLVPALKMLLNLDKAEEQKWLGVVAR